MATTTPAGAPAPKTFAIPNGATVYSVNGSFFAVYQVAGGVRISYKLDPKTVQFDKARVRTVTGAQFHALRAVNAGLSEELRGMREQFSSYQQFFDRILDEVVGSTNPARKDAGVLRVLAEYAGRPDMSAAELQNKLQATQWYQTRTQSELEWNGLSTAEKDKRREESAQDMANVWMQYGGANIDRSDPRIANYLDKVASGKMGFGQFTELVKKAAEGDPDSPWSRQLAEEEKARGQKGIDIENTAQRVRDLARRWGVQMSDQTFQEMANGIVAGTTSEADVLNVFKDQASVLFPWKDRDVETSVIASPWVETYQRLMEAQTDVMNPKVQQAMSGGMSVWDFEKSLKQSGEWLNTKNAREELTTTISEVGRRMGFE